MAALNQKLNLGKTQAVSVAVVYNQRQNLYFVKFLEQGPALVLQCECSNPPCGQCAKFQSAGQHLVKLKTCACAAVTAARGYCELHCRVANRWHPDRVPCGPGNYPTGGQQNCPSG